MINSNGIVPQPLRLVKNNFSSSDEQSSDEDISEDSDGTELKERVVKFSYKPKSSETN